jgi:hypothetical protein
MTTDMNLPELSEDLAQRVNASLSVTASMDQRKTVIETLAALLNSAVSNLRSWEKTAVTPMGVVMADVTRERHYQNGRWGEQNHPHGTGSNLDRSMADYIRACCKQYAAAGTLTWRHILDEEVAEAYAETDPAKLRAELVQVAATAANWVEAIDREQTYAAR